MVPRRRVEVLSCAGERKGSGPGERDLRFSSCVGHEPAWSWKALRFGFVCLFFTSWPLHLQVLVYELLLGRGFRGRGGRWKPLLNRHQARLKAELARLKVHRGVSRNEDLLEVGCGPGAGELGCGGGSHQALRWRVPA